MRSNHNPALNVRYWVAIALASVFGTNMGDLYAHDSGLGIGAGLAVLAALTAAVFAAERFDEGRREVYYWAVIFLIRTGATNIADWLAYRVRVPDAVLVSGIALLLALFAWGTTRPGRGAVDADHRLPATGTFYWLAMLAAGVFGTVVGDMCQHWMGRGAATLALTVLLAGVLVAARQQAARYVALYWSVIAVARTAGTAVGDWLAGRRGLHLGLPMATAFSGLLFVGVLVFWPGALRVRRLSEAV